MQNLTMCHFTPGDQINDPRQTIIIQILYSALSYLWRRPFPSIILKRRESSVVVVSQVLNMIWNNFQEDFSPKSSLMSSYKRIVRMKTVETWEYLPPSQLRISLRHILTLPKKISKVVTNQNHESQGASGDQLVLSPFPLFHFHLHLFLYFFLGICIFSVSPLLLLHFHLDYHFIRGTKMYAKQFQTL